MKLRKSVVSKIVSRNYEFSGRFLLGNLITFSAILMVTVFGAGPVHGEQPPINIIFDMHADPIPQASFEEKQDYFTMQLENGNWVLDQVERFGAEISFLSVGEFMEFVSDGGEDGEGAEFLRRIYENGGQIGSHSHAEYMAAPYSWPSFTDGSYENSLISWGDDIDWVNRGIITALGLPLPEPIRSINCVKGAHIPDSSEDYRTLMVNFGMKIKQGGEEEDYIAIYNHYIMNPYRPALYNQMTGDPDGPFVVSPQGSVIGKQCIHHGIFQDMSAPNVKRMFIQTYLNWRYRDRNGLEPMVWSFGWGSHLHDYEPGSETRADMVEMLRWLRDNFVDKREQGTGSTIADWSTQRETAGEYVDWEQNHPGAPGFVSNGEFIDWNEYPYLRAVCSELWETRHVADLDLGDGLKGWLLHGGYGDLVVAFTDDGAETIDLSGFFAGPCRVVSAETGYVLGTRSDSVVVGMDPVIVTSDAPRISIVGRPFPGGAVTLHMRGASDASEGSFYLSSNPTDIDIPFMGRLRIMNDGSLKCLGSGRIVDGSLDVVVHIPNDPSLVGRRFFIQGRESCDWKTTLSLNSLEVVVESRPETNEL